MSMDRISEAVSELVALVIVDGREAISAQTIHGETGDVWGVIVVRGARKVETLKAWSAEHLGDVDEADLSVQQYAIAVCTCSEGGSDAWTPISHCPVHGAHG